MSTPEFPTTEMVRSAWVLTRANHDDEIAGAVAEFNDWLRAVKADVFDEALIAGDAFVGNGGDTPNPYEIGN